MGKTLAANSGAGGVARARPCRLPLIFAHDGGRALLWVVPLNGASLSKKTCQYRKALQKNGIEPSRKSVAAQKAAFEVVRATASRERDVLHGAAIAPIPTLGGHAMATVSIHPAVDNGVKAGSPSFAGGTLQCKCASNPVEVKVTAQSAHNHVCGCTKCWKPAGALFSWWPWCRATRSASPRTPTGSRPSTPCDHPTPRLHRLRRYMYGRIENTKHPMGSISSTPSCRRIRVVGSRVRRLRVLDHQIGAPPDQMGAVRSRLKELRLEPYDCLCRR